VDYSDAERLGFVEAFVAFWKRRKDNFRIDKELREAAASLLKGCQEHYRTQVNRVKRISAVVSPGLQDAFANEAMALIEANDYDDFTQRVNRLIKKFPKAEGCSMVGAQATRHNALQAIPQDAGRGMEFHSQNNECSRITTLQNLFRHREETPPHTGVERAASIITPLSSPFKRGFG
jgi:hypothetical protein